MARGTQHRKRSPRTNAAASTTAVARPHKAKTPQWQDELFFQRLRNHAKWVYVGLAVTFMLGFVLLGVGSGSTGIGDALQNAFHFGGNGTSISSLESKAAKHPQSAAAWRALATAYEQKQRPADAVTALERYTALRPKDTNALGELATQYTSLATTYQNDYSVALTNAQLTAPAGAFLPPATSPLGRAYNDPNALQDPISTAVQSVAQTSVQDAYTKLQSTSAKAEDVYKKLVALTPKDATLQIQLGQAAQTAGDTTTALAAYRRFLKLAPTDPLAPQVRKVVKSLAASAAQSSAQAAG